MDQVFSLRSHYNVLKISGMAKKSKFNLFVVLILAFIILSSTIISSKYFEIPYSDYMRDPVVLMGGELYLGWFSQLGVMLWSVAAGFCFLSARLVGKDQTLPLLKHFLYYSFFLTALLGADDVFMFHDEIFPYWGIHENIFISGYLLIVSLYLILFYKVIFKTEFLLLGFAFFFFASSILLDKIPHNKKILVPGGWESIIYEDGFKMIGILFWVVYFYSVGKFSLEKKEI